MSKNCQTCTSKLQELFEANSVLFSSVDGDKESALYIEEALRCVKDWINRNLDYCVERKQYYHSNSPQDMQDLGKINFAKKLLDEIVMLKQIGERATGVGDGSDPKKCSSLSKERQHRSPKNCSVQKDGER